VSRATKRAIFAALMATALGACASDLSSKAKPPPDATGLFVSGAVAPFDPTQAPPVAWWRLFDDPALDALVQQALEANKDLAVAAANLQRTRAALSEQRSARLPATQTSASATRGRESAAAQGLPGRLPDSNIYDAGVDVSYEVDLFWRVGHAISAARADTAASRAAYEGVRISVVAETARAYADACSAARQLAVARETADLQRQTFTITERRVEAGRDSPSTLAQARALVAQSEAAIPGFESARQSALFRLATLVGVPPAQAPETAKACATAPAVNALLPIGDGAALLGRRPDVREAQSRLAAASARVGVARADLLPRIVLGASGGATGPDRDELGAASTVRWSAGPLITWSFPNLMAVGARVRQAKASDRAAFAAYEGTILAALEETESALAAYAGELDRRASLREARDQSLEAARIVKLRYDSGREGFLAVLDAQRVLASAEAALAASDAAVTTGQIRVFKALGGGWEW